MIRTDGRPTIAVPGGESPPPRTRADVEAVAAALAATRGCTLLEAQQAILGELAVKPCTCTLACEPRAITEEQDCKESLSCLADTLVSDDTALD